MASNSQQQPRELCRYFMNGVCRFGTNCFNSHDRNDRPSTVCRYYLAGSCTYGSSCRYDHIRPKAPNASTSPTSTNTVSNNPVSLKSATSTPSPHIAPTANPISTATSAVAVRDDDSSSNMVVLGRRKGNTNEYDKLISNIENNRPSTSGFTSKSLSSVSQENSDINKKPSSFIEALTGAKPSEQKETTDQYDHEPGYHYPQPQQQLCPYYEKEGICPFMENEGICEYLHGEICDVCGLNSLHPFDEIQRNAHLEECSKQMEKDMEEAFATQQSQDKQCGICMETVWDKEVLTDQRFGVLENCNHTFCLNCIRKWRSSKSYENKIVKACPECRVKSDFVTPSRYWFENENDKKKIISEYKTKLGETSCKYFKQGEGSCPFGNKCFYLHQYPDGTKADLPSPQRRRRLNQNGLLEAFSNVVQIDFDLSDDEYDDQSEFDFGSDYSDLSMLELFDNLFFDVMNP